MKHLTLFVAAVMALVVAGCGGSGGDNGGNNPPDDVLSTPRIEAVVRIERSNLVDPNRYTDEELLDPQVVSPSDLIVPSVYGVQDLSNFQTGESYYFQLVSYTEAGRRVILSDATFSTDDTQAVHGQVGDSGLYLASNVPTSEPSTVFATYNGTRYSATYQLFERRVRAIGKVLAEGTNEPIDGVTVEFYNADGTLVASVVSGYDGSYRASVPLSTALVSVNSQKLSNAFFRSYVVNDLRYDAGDADCRTPISFDGTGPTDVATIYVTPRVAGQSTPIADGCTDGGGEEL